MAKVLILFAHPRLEKSRANTALIAQIPDRSEITFHDLYEAYPDFDVDVEVEKRLLEEHDVIVWHHPLYWYGSPPLVKQWIDMVLELGWACGPGGRALEGKLIFNAITSGGAREAYRREGYNRFTVREFLAPFEQTATLCRMVYLAPFVVQGTHRLDDDALSRHARDYARLLDGLADGRLDAASLGDLETLNLAVVDTNATGE